MLVLVVLVLVATMYFSRSMSQSRTTAELPYGHLYADLTSGKLSEVLVS